MIDTLDTRMQALETSVKRDARSSLISRRHQAAASAGDYSLALASLRKFYDYRFPKSGRYASKVSNQADLIRGQHQHALLNLASYHYSTGGMEAARHVRTIHTARTADMYRPLKRLLR